MVVRFVSTLNGISIAYVMALVNSGLAVLLSFGVNITQQQDAAVVGFVNAAFVLLAHVSHRNGEVHPTPSAWNQGTPVVSPEPPPATPPVIG